MSTLDEIKKNARSARWIGVLLLIAGFFALMAPLAAGASIAMMVGFLLLFCGVGHLVLVFQSGSFGRGVFILLLAALNLLAGIYMIARPGIALAALALFLAAYFVATGITEIVAAFQARPDAGWGWLAFGGALSALLGLMIWSQFPLSGAWAVGVLVGLRLFTSGWELIAIGGAAGAVAQSPE